jgi:hypothetical protein
VFERAEADYTGWLIVAAFEIETDPEGVASEWGAGRGEG